MDGLLLAFAVHGDRNVAHHPGIRLTGEAGAKHEHQGPDADMHHVKPSAIILDD